MNGPIAGRPLTTETCASGSSSRNSRATARAGRSCPSPMSAEMIRMLRGGASASGSPAGITAASTRSAAISRLVATPVDVPPHTIGKRRPRRPPKLNPRPLARDDLPTEITRTRRREHDLRVPNQLLHRLRDLPDRHIRITREVVHPVARRLHQTTHHTLGQVLHIHKPPRLQTITRQRQRLTLERLVHKRRDHRRLPRPRAIRNPEPQNRVIDPVQLLVALAVELAGELGRRVQMTRRRQQRVLVDMLGLAIAVHPDRRRIHHALDTRPAAGLEHGRRFRER